MTQNSSLHRPLRIAAIVLGLLAAATLLTHIVFPDPTRRVILFYFIVVIFVAWRWGTLPGLLTTFLSSALFSALVWPQLLDFTNTPLPSRLLLGLLLVGSALSLASGRRIHAEKRLAESEQRFRALADTAPVLIWLSDPSNARTWFNKAWLNFRGKQLSDEYATAFTRGIHPEDLPAFLASSQEAFDDRQPFSLEYRLQRADESYRWVLDNGIPRFTPDNQFLGYIGSCVDIHQHKTGLQKFEEHAELLNTTLSSIADAVIATDLDSRITFMNPIAEKETGCTIQTALHMPLNEVLRRVHENTHSPLTTLSTSSEPTLLLRPDGSSIPIEHSAAPIRDSAGTPRGHVIVFRNIAARRKHDAGRELLSRIAKTLSSSLDYEANLWNVARMAVPLLGDACVIHHLNEHGQALSLALGCSDPDLEKKLNTLLHNFRPETTDLHGPAEAVQKGRSILYSQIPDAMLTEVARNNEHLAMLRAIRAVSAMFIPLKIHDRTIGIVSFVSTQPNRHFNPDDLALAEELTAHAANAIHNARLFQEKDRADKAKDHFLAVLSHELRTPLTPVLSVVSMLSRIPNLDPSIREDLRLVKRNVELEARLIDDLLDLTRIRKGKFVLEKSEVHIPDLLQETLAICQPEATERGIQLALSSDCPSPSVLGDPTRLQQAFWNIVKNAIKFSPAGGTVRISCTNAPDSLIRVTITDTGVGIEPEFLNRIFDAFQQAEQDGRRFGGLGLGLAITRAIIERHKGSIQAHSQGVNSGTTFTVDLPARPAAPAPAKPPREIPSQPLRKLNIFLIEDHKDTALVMARFLSTLGHKITVANSCSHARQLFKPATFQLIVSDIGLTDGNGTDLLRELHQIEKVPAIALSGNGMDSDIRLSLAAGFRAHLTKPLDIEALESAIQLATADAPS